MLRFALDPNWQSANPESETFRTFSEVVRHIMEQQKMHPKDLAYKLNISSSKMSRILNNSNGHKGKPYVPDPYIVGALMVAFGLNQKERHFLMTVAFPTIYVAAEICDFDGDNCDYDNLLDDYGYDVPLS